MLTINGKTKELKKGRGGWTKNELIDACRRRGLDFRVSWDKEKFCELLRTVGATQPQKEEKRDKVPTAEKREEVNVGKGYYEFTPEEMREPLLKAGFDFGTGAPRELLYATYYSQFVLPVKLRQESELVVTEKEVKELLKLNKLVRTRGKEEPTLRRFLRGFCLDLSIKSEEEVRNLCPSLPTEELPKYPEIFTQREVESLARKYTTFKHRVNRRPGMSVNALIGVATSTRRISPWRPNTHAENISRCINEFVIETVAGNQTLFFDEERVVYLKPTGRLGESKWTRIYALGVDNIVKFLLEGENLTLTIHDSVLFAPPQKVVIKLERVHVLGLLRICRARGNGKYSESYRLLLELLQKQALQTIFYQQDEITPEVGDFLFELVNEGIDTSYIPPKAKEVYRKLQGRAVEGYLKVLEKTHVQMDAARIVGGFIARYI